MEIIVKEDSNDSKYINIFVDGNFYRKVFRTLFKKSFSFEKSFSSLEEFDEYFSDLEYRLAKKYTYDILSKKNYLEKEIEKKLLERKITHQTCFRVIEYLKKNKFLDDDRIIQRVIKKEKDKGYGPLKILAKLKSKQIYNYEIDFSSNEQVMQITKLIDKKHNLQKLKDENLQKLYLSLQRRGFSSDVISQALFKIQHGLDNVEKE